MLMYYTFIYLLIGESICFNVRLINVINVRVIEFWNGNRIIHDDLIISMKMIHFPVLKHLNEYMYKLSNPIVNKI